MTSTSVRTPSAPDTSIVDGYGVAEPSAGIWMGPAFENKRAPDGPVGCSATPDAPALPVAAAVASSSKSSVPALGDGPRRARGGVPDEELPGAVRVPAVEYGQGGSVRGSRRHAVLVPEPERIDRGRAERSARERTLVGDRLGVVVEGDGQTRDGLLPTHLLHQERGPFARRADQEDLDVLGERMGEAVERDVQVGDRAGESLDLDRRGVRIALTRLRERIAAVLDT